MSKVPISLGEGCALQQFREYLEEQGLFPKRWGKPGKKLIDLYEELGGGDATLFIVSQGGEGYTVERHVTILQLEVILTMNPPLALFETSREIVDVSPTSTRRQEHPGRVLPALKVRKGEEFIATAQRMLNGRLRGLPVKIEGGITLDEQRVPPPSAGRTSSFPGITDVYTLRQARTFAEPTKLIVPGNVFIHKELGMTRSVTTTYSWLSPTGS